MENENNIKKEKVTRRDCCGGAPANNKDACCVLDEQKIAEGKAGCGCNRASSGTPATAKNLSCC